MDLREVHAAMRAQSAVSMVRLRLARQTRTLQGADVAVLGLGRVGEQAVRQLVRAGAKVTVYDANPSRKVEIPGVKVVSLAAQDPAKPLSEVIGNGHAAVINATGRNFGGLLMLSRQGVIVTHTARALKNPPVAPLSPSVFRMLKQRYPEAFRGD